MHKWLFLLTLFTLCLPLAVPAQELSADLYQAAQAGLTRFIPMLDPAMLELWGINNREEVKDFSLDKPLRLHIITPKAINDYREGDAASSLLCQSQCYYFPVRLGGEIKLFLLVDQVDGEWKAVSLGYQPLAKEMQNILQQWQKSERPVLAAMFQARTYLFTMPQQRADNLTPITWSGDSSRSRSYTTLQSTAATVAMLKSLIKDYWQEDLKFQESKNK
jgi:hypothetical protein